MFSSAVHDIYRNPEMSEDIVIPESLRISTIEVDMSKVLGRGSYGVVYEACYHGAKVAVKKLHAIFFDDVSADENIGILKSWNNELQLMSKILHPNIVQFYGVYNSENQKSLKLSGNTFIVSELMHKSLRTRNLEKPKLEYSEIINILYDIAAGLSYLHKRSSPIMHRDLASKNILLTISGQAKIADLGVAKIISQKKESLTRHPGTDAYMPVEAIAFENSYDCSIDIYSLGVIGLELGVGRDPKAGQCLKKVETNYVAVEEEERRKDDFADLECSCNAHLKVFILQCLDKMESRIEAISALEWLLIEKQKKTEGPSTSSEKNSTEQYIKLQEENSRLEMENEKLKKEKENLLKVNQKSLSNTWLEMENEKLKKEKENLLKANQEKLSAFYSRQDKDKQELDQLKKDVELYRKLLKEKDNEIKRLQHLESKKQVDSGSTYTSFAKRPIDSGSSYISRDPPVNAHYNYTQLSMPTHGKLVVPSAGSRSTISRQPTISSQQSYSAKARPASTIVTGTSHPTSHTFMSQRSHSEDNCLSDETRHPPPLPSEAASSQSVASTVQNVLHSLTNYSQRFDKEFMDLKNARTAGAMANHMKSLKSTMETYLNYTMTVPKQIKDNPEVNYFLMKVEKNIELLKNVNLHRIAFNQTDQLSQIARILQSQL